MIMCAVSFHSRLAIISVVLGAFTFGCGGGGVPSSPQINPNAQTSGSAPQTLQSPMLGFAYTTTETEVRVINGVSGASTQGAALSLPTGVAAVNFAPGQKSALVEVSGGGSVGTVSFLASQPGPLVTIAGAISHPDIVAFSPTGAAAALYSASEGHVQVITGFPNSPQLTRDLTAAQLPAAPQMLAVADDGVTLLEGTADNAIYLLSSSNPQLLANVSALGGIAFNPKSTNLLIFDRGSGSLTLVPSVGGVPSEQVIAEGLTGLEGTVLFASDGRNALIGGTNVKSVWEVNLQTSQQHTLSLQTPPSMLTPLRTPGDYLVAWQPGGLAWIIDTNPPQGAVYLVPAAATAQAELAQ
jgi:hypothetical protein